MDKEEDQKQSSPVPPIKRDSDSMDDFEHVEDVVCREKPSPSDVNPQLVEVSRAPTNLFDRETNVSRNLLDTTVQDDSKEDILKPVPATPPPSADFDKFSDQMSGDPFTSNLQDHLGRFDPKRMTSEFVESERNFQGSREEEDREDRESLNSGNDFFGRGSDDDSSAKSMIERERGFQEDKDMSVKESVLPAPEKAPVMDFLGDEGSWGAGAGAGTAPTKPLPPVPRDGGVSGNETGDSEFESEPEPSPAKVASAHGGSRLGEERQDLEEIAPRKIFADMGLVAALIYWRQPEKTGAVFGAILGVLLSLAYFSLISVFSYVALLTLTGTLGFRIYKTIMQAVQKTSDGHPFKDILEVDLTLPAEKVHEVADVFVAHANAAVSELRRLFLIEDFIDSLKFGVGLWCLTYVGSWFNGMTLIIIGVVALFTLPKVYETNKAQIDQNLALVQGKINELTAKVKAAIPLGKKAEPTKEE
ncbi:reticulon-1 isoform X2 [Diachasma alloeum]|uniref:reticulon-1 isoform X2 n=1 Tax=Diachasma alloeum TaxID=454923 RepID=UPI00073811F7|nr:reticulon-1 isoform X2 [Diachasma alloeum]